MDNDARTTDRTDTDTDAQILELARLEAKAILESGGETYRAEDTVTRVCRAGGRPASEVIALPTGVFLSLVSKDGTRASTMVERVRVRDVDLMRLDHANSVARRYTSGSLSAAEACAELRDYERTAKKTSPLAGAAIAAASSLLFSLLFGGSLADGLTAAAAGFTVRLTASRLRRVDVYNFTLSLSGGAIIAAFAVAAAALTRRFGWDVSLSADKIIIGAIMPLLPGLAMTNAIRDTMTGDLVSGVSRFAEVLLTAVAIAGGVGAVLSLYLKLGGTL